MKKIVSIHSRRSFLKTGAAALAASSGLFAASPLLAAAKRLNLPVGLQLYSVRTLLPKDYEGTLRQLGALGYREVEAAGFYNRTAAQVKRDMREAGLHCVSAHYSFDKLHDPKQLDRIIAYIKELGASYIVCPGPGHKDPSNHTDLLTLAEWQWNAEQLNKLGEKVHAAGLRFGYHNHVREFRKTDGVVPYFELLRLTDPAKVAFELDCGWAVVAGANPVKLLREHPTRIAMLHVKDFKDIDKSRVFDPDYEPASAALGQGSIDYAPIFAQAAKGGHIRHAFVEQEEYNMPPMKALKIDADYMKKFHA